MDVVSLNVSVTDGAKHFLTDLDPSESIVFEDGVKQDVDFFVRRQQPVALSLLLDSSASMTSHMPTLQTAARNFVKRLRPDDHAQVVDFDGNIRILQPFTSSQAALESAIQQTFAGGSTALYQAIYIALRELERAPALSDEESRRRALVVFSDGEDTSSLVEFDELMDLAKRADTSIYTIALRDTRSEAKGFREAEHVLRMLAQETGGRVFFPTRIDDLNSVYDEIAEEIGNQYTLGYTSKNLKHDGSWRRLAVRLSRPNATARTKRGYYAPRAK